MLLFYIVQEHFVYYMKTSLFQNLSPVYQHRKIEAAHNLSMLGSFHFDF